MAMAEITQLLDRISDGDLSANELLPVLYHELRSMAAVRLARERDCQTLQPTALVHEAYVRLFDSRMEGLWKSRAHFFGAAAEAMRRILIERARRRMSIKAGGDFNRVPFHEVETGEPLSSHDILELHEAISRLEQLFPRKASIVKLRFFAGLTHSQIADVLDVSIATVENDWAYARCWLRLELQSELSVR